MPRAELYVGNLTRDVTQKDIEEVFDKYGRVLRCDIKNRGPGAVYCFLEFEDDRDAEDALKSENGKDLFGNSMLIEFAKGGGPRGGGGYRGTRSARANECYECGQPGHFARDCRGRNASGRNRMSRSSRDRRSRDRRDSRSPDRDRDRGDRGGDRGGNNNCFRCGQPGHFARDCRGGDNRGSSGRRDRSRDRDRRRDRRSRSRSDSRDNRRRSRSRTRSPRTRSRSRTRSHS